MASSLLLDESVYEKIPEVKKPIFIYDWLRTLERNILTEDKQTIKECQEDLVQQLLCHLTHAQGRPTHELIGRCLTNLFMSGDTLLLYTAVNTCNGLLKSRDELPSSINNRLAALTCLGAVYNRLGRSVGRSFEDSVLIMVKHIKQSESQVRCETMNTLSSLLEGVGSAGSICHKEIFKAAKVCMTDRVPCVREAAAKCLYNLVDHSQTIHTSELESTISLCLRCMDGATYTTRLETARLLGYLLAKTQCMPSCDSGGVGSHSFASSTSGASNTINVRSKATSLSDVLSLLASGFIKGPGGFLKASSAADMLKGTNSVNREVRVGVTYAYVHFFMEMGSSWFESNLSVIIMHLTNLLMHPRSTPTHVEAICARQCVHYILCTVIRNLLTESMQLATFRKLVHALEMQLIHDLPVNCNEHCSPDTAVNSVDLNFDNEDMVANLETDSNNNNNNHVGVVTSSNNNNIDATHITASGNTSTIITYSPGTNSNTSGKAIRRAFGSKQTNTRKRNQEQQQQHVLICYLDLINKLIQWIDSLCIQLLDQSCNLLDVLYTCLIHPQHSVRLASAACLKQLVTVLPNQRIPLLNHCINYLQHFSQRSNMDALLGYGDAVCGLLAGLNSSILGISDTMTKQLFSLGEELLRGANQNSRFTLARTQTGWNILAACMSLGPHLVRPYLARMLLFWCNAFPRTKKELEAEKQRGDAFTWQMILEARCGALCSMQCFLQYCSPTLLTEEVIHRLLQPIECALNMVSQLGDIVRMYGNHLKSSVSFIRLRLYRLLILLPPSTYSAAYSTLLRELVTEFTLTENQTNVTTSLLKSLCRDDDGLTVGIWHWDNDQNSLEELLQPCCMNSLGALEHDAAFLFLREGCPNTLRKDFSFHDIIHSEKNLANQTPLTTGFLFHGPGDRINANLSSLNRTAATGINAYTSYRLERDMSSHPVVSATSCYSSLSASLSSNSPLPIAVSVIDASIDLFGYLFPFVPARHRTQMLEHFAECIRLTKSLRQEVVQLNVYASLLSALICVAENTKGSFGDDANLLKAATSLIFNGLTSPNPLLRCAASECLGRLAKVIGEPTCLTEMITQLFERLRTMRNPVARAGHCLAIGCVHRHVGVLATSQHLSASVSTLLAIAQDSSVPEVQVWALYALALVADSGGPIFREYVEPIVHLVLQLLLKSPGVVNEIQCSLARLFAALIATLGPELQGSSEQIAATRRSCLLCCAIMHNSPDPILQAESINCLQQLHMFASMHVNLVTLVPELEHSLTSPHLVVRRAALGCLRQLYQKGVVVNTKSVINADLFDSVIFFSPRRVENEASHLELQLFRMLDIEIDDHVCRDVEDILIALLESNGCSQLNYWFNLLKQVLKISTVVAKFNERNYDQINTHSGECAPNQLNNCIKPNRSDTGFDDMHVNQDGNAGYERQIKESNVHNDDYDDDVNVDTSFRVEHSNHEDKVNVVKLMERCSTRIFAIDCLRLLISTCTRSSLSTNTSTQCVNSNDMSAHFDLAKARALKSSNGKSDWLIFYLPDLIRVAFMSTTSESDQLRIAGLKLMQDLIEHFSAVTDPDFPGHSILEQYQTQVSASIKAAFNSHHAHMNPELIVYGCQVCASWICSGVAQNVTDFCHVQDLIKQSYQNLFHQPKQAANVDADPNPTNRNDDLTRFISDNVNVIEKLAVLNSWAQIYITSVEQYLIHSIQSNNFKHVIGSDDDDDDDDEDDHDINGDMEIEDEEEEEEEDNTVAVGAVQARHHSFTSNDHCGQETECLNSNTTNLISILHKNPFMWNIFNKTNYKNIKHCRRSFQLLSGLVSPILADLNQTWLGALRDYAYLNLPDDLANQCPNIDSRIHQTNCAPDQIRLYYAHYWPVLAYAASIWQIMQLNKPQSKSDHDTFALKMEKDFYLIVGMCVQALCNPASQQPLFVVRVCLRCLVCLLSQSKFRALLMKSSNEMALELLQVIHRIILTRDCVETHLLCMGITYEILIGAVERLTKEREDWLTKDTPSQKSSVLINSESMNKLPASSMTSSTILQTTGVVDAEMYEYAEGGYLTNYFDHNPVTSADHDIVISDSDDPDVSTFAGLQCGASIVFACLETLISTLARYRPEIIRECQICNNKFSQSTEIFSPKHIPDFCRSDHPNASFVLGAVIKCFIPLVDLCAPRTLLTSMCLTKPHFIHSPNTNGRRRCSKLAANEECLLPLLLDLSTQTIITCLLKQTPVQSTDQFTNQNQCRKSPTSLECVQLTDVRNWISNAGLNADDSEITSSTTTRSDKYRKSRGIKHQLRAIEQFNLQTLVGWSIADLQMAEIYIQLIVKLANHHYPKLAASIAQQQRQILTDKDNADQLTQPDSSSTMHKDDSVDVENSDKIKYSTGLVYDAEGWTNSSKDENVFISVGQWFDLISQHILSLLQHSHEDTVDPPLLKCCLACEYLVSHICFDCPPQLFKRSELVTAITGMLCKTWRLSCLINADKLSINTKDNPSSLTLFGLQIKQICLTAMQLFCNHYEIRISSLFIKTLTPLVFRWLYDLSKFLQNRRTQEQITDQTQSKISVQDFTCCLNLAIDLLVSIVEKAQMEKRQALLLILFPLLCNLLLTESYKKQQQSLEEAGCTERSNDSQQYFISMYSSYLTILIDQITLRHITSLAPHFPNEFRTICSAIGDLKLRVENSIKYAQFHSLGLTDHRNHQHHLFHQKQRILHTANVSDPHNENEVHTQTIQLKTDFSHYK